MNDASSIAADLSAEWSDLMRQWEETRALWRDKVAQEFEATYWRRWDSQVPAFQAAIEDYDQLMREALDGTE